MRALKWLHCSIVVLAACTGLKDPQWDTADRSQSVQGGGDWRDDDEPPADTTTTGGAETGSAVDTGIEGSESDGSSGGVGGATVGSGSGGEASGAVTDGGDETGASGDDGVGSDSSGSEDGGAEAAGSEAGGGESSASTDGGGGGAASGVGGWVMLYFNVNAYPELLETPLIQFSAESRMHPPLDASWLSYMPSLGSCTVDPVRGVLGAVGYDMGASATLSSSSAVIPMSRRDTTNDYLIEELPSSSWVNDASYSIQFADGRMVENALRTTGGFDTIEPPFLRSEGDGAIAFETPLSMSGQTFTWSPVAVSDGLLLSLTAYDPVTYARKTELLCNAPDVGSYTVSASSFAMASGMAPYDILMVGISRYRRSYSISPVDGSIVEGFAQKGGTGTATLFP